jgi:hypothetical protein
VCVAVAVVALAVLHLDGIGVVDPVVQVISDYVVLPGGFAVLGVAAIALAVASGLLAAVLRTSGLVDAGAPAALLATASGGFVGAAVFPTNDPGTEVGVVANVHRVAGAVVLVTLPLAALLTARRAARSVHWRSSAVALSWAAGCVSVLSGVFLLSHVPIVITDSPIFTASGALQRVLYVMVMVVLLMIARASRSAIDAVRAGAELPPGAAEVRGIA